MTHLVLGSSQFLSDRPFTNPAYGPEDLLVLHRMLEGLRLILTRLSTFPGQPLSFQLRFQEDDGCRHRVVICNLVELLSAEELTVVGFFGEQRPNLDPELVRLIESADLELIGQLDHSPGVLSYSSLRLETGNWGNLVLFNSPEAVQHWGTGTRHGYVARELSPKYYLTIRLHNGSLPGGVMSDAHLILHRTKYYDFRGNTSWHAVREIEANDGPESILP